MAGVNRAWLQRLDAGRVLLADGATGTELRRRGVRLDPAAWSGPASLWHPELLETIHTEYLLAGADVVTTNTFGTNRFVLAAAGYGDRFEAANRAAFEAARRARDAVRPDAAIAGSISCLPPGFDTARYPDPRAELDAYLELASFLADLGADLLVLEMMEDVEHASRACEAARRIGLPFWLGVSCRFDRSGRLVAYDFPGTPLAEVLDTLLSFSPAAVNVMHTPAAAVSAALGELGARWRGYRGAYPELGSDAATQWNRPTTGVTTTVTEAPAPAPATSTGTALPASADASPARLADLAMTWVADGARILGGCCGSTPAHIRALREALDRGAH